MKIGILTFHWATNYGAVLQCYALQCFLENMGHDIAIINYKPSQFDDTFSSFIKRRKFYNINSYLIERRREKALLPFRDAKLHQTERVRTCNDVENISSRFDIIISGSDQILNSGFLCNGDGRGIVTPTYFLGFPFKGKKIGYALSFGVVYYPERAREIASKYIGEFNIISVRENSGVDIVKSMGRGDAVVVPDPTLLMNSKFYNELITDRSFVNEVFIFAFFIRHISERKRYVNSILRNQKVIWNNEDGNYSMEGWLAKIKYASFVITDSFHCMVMCLKLHRPFIVITELQGKVGMNDRFYTLLGKMGLESLILHKTDKIDYDYYISKSINWEIVDSILNEYKNIGKDFLSKITST